MSWRDDFQTGSFRAVEFHAREVGLRVSRRLAKHEFAGRDVGYIEDLGRLGDEIELEARYVGENYIVHRNALIAACRAPGAGELIHPTRGAIKVHCRGLSVREDWVRDGGGCTMQLSFMEAGAEPGVESDPSQAAAAAGLALDVAATAELDEDLELSGPAYLLDAVTSTMQDAIAFVEDSALVGAINDIAKFKQGLTDFVSSIGSFATQALTFASETVKLFTEFDTVFGGFEQAVASWLLIVDNDPDLPSAESTFQVQANANATATNTFIGNLALGRAVAAASKANWKTTEEAETARNQIAARLNTAIETASGSTVGELQDLLAALLNSVPRPGIALPNLTEFTPNELTTSLHVAYELFGDVGRSDEVIERNRVIDPGFIIGGVGLEVLSA
jgi:prophage DNA circulation protein